MRFMRAVTWPNYKSTPVEPERENGLLDQALSDHVLEHGHDSLDRDGRVGHAKDAVELAGDEHQAGLLDRFGERLVHHLNTGDAQNVSRQETGHGTSAVLNAKISSIRFVGRRQRRVVNVVVAFLY